MGADDAILILICSYVGAIYGGSRSAILLNIPGTPANAATTLDGFPLARAGHAGRAMGLATTGSFLGSLIGMLLLALVAPVLARVRARLRQLRVFLAGRVRHRDLGPSHGPRRSAQGLDRGLPGPDGRHGGPGGHPVLRALHLRQHPARRRFWAFAGAGGRLRLCRGHHGDGPAGLRIGALGDRPGRAELARGRRLLAHHHPLGPDRHADGAHPGRGRGHRRLGLLRGRPARQQGAGKIRKGLGRGAARRRDRQQRGRARRHHPGADAGRPGLGTRRPSSWPPCSSTACGPAP